MEAYKERISDIEGEKNQVLRDIETINVSFSQRAAQFYHSALSVTAAADVESGGMTSTQKFEDRTSKIAKNKGDLETLYQKKLEEYDSKKTQANLLQAKAMYLDEMINERSKEKQGEKKVSIIVFLECVSMCLLSLLS